MPDDCLFCRIVAGTIPAEIVEQTETTTAFRDISPQAPTHLLIIPNQHVASASAVTTPEVFAELLSTTTRLAQRLDLSDYRLVINNGAGAGQTVFHLHLHLLAGREFAWPPG